MNYVFSIDPVSPLRKLGWQGSTDNHEGNFFLLSGNND